MLFSYEHFQQKTSLHSDASMYLGSPNTEFHWILYTNGRVRTHAQCHQKTTDFESEFELIEALYTFLLRNHIVISKNVSDDVFDRLLTNNQCHQTQRLFRN